MSNLIKVMGDDLDIKELVAMDKFLEVINSNPPEQFITEHPTVKGVKDIGISKVELMLDKIFQRWYVEVLREGQLLNSIYCTIRLHYKHPVSKEWQAQDGVGAVPIQVDKGQDASNLAAIKHDAIMKSLPAAKSYAIKDAADHIGKIFGRDLNRKDAVSFTPSYGTDEVKDEMEAKKQAQRERMAKARAARKATQ